MPRDMLALLRCTLCALVGSVRPTDEVEGLPLLLLDTKSISKAFAGRHVHLGGDSEGAEKKKSRTKTVKMRSLAGLLTLKEQDLYIPMFGMMDVDGDGCVEMASVLKVLECSGLSASTQVKILNLALQGDAWREINAIEFTRGMQLAAVAQEGENICQDVYNSITGAYPSWRVACGVWRACDDTTYLCVCACCCGVRECGGLISEKKWVALIDLLSRRTFFAPCLATVVFLTVRTLCGL